MSKNPDLANFLLHKKSVSTKKFVKSVFYVIFTVVKSVDYCIEKICQNERSFALCNLNVNMIFFSK